MINVSTELTTLQILRDMMIETSKPSALRPHRLSILPANVPKQLSFGNPPSYSSAPVLHFDSCCNSRQQEREFSLFWYLKRRIKVIAFPERGDAVITATAIANKRPTTDGTAHASSAVPRTTSKTPQLRMACGHRTRKLSRQLRPSRSRFCPSHVMDLPLSRPHKNTATARAVVGAVKVIRNNSIRVEKMQRKLPS